MILQVLSMVQKPGEANRLGVVWDSVNNGLNYLSTTGDRRISEPSTVGLRFVFLVGYPNNEILRGLLGLCLCVNNDVDAGILYIQRKDILCVYVPTVSFVVYSVVYVLESTFF